MNKIANSLVGLVVAFTSFAHAGPLADQAQQIADRLRAIENELSRRDASDIFRSLDNAQYILEGYRGGGSSENLACIGDGQPPAFQKFYLTDLDTNSRLGNGTSLSTCQAILQNQKNGFMCLSDGQPPAFEKFTLYQRDVKRSLGRGTGFNTCKALIDQSTSSFICLSDGQPAAFEKFTLFNTRTNKVIGAGVGYNTCIASIPR